MPWRVWIVSAVLVGWSSVQLWRAKTLGKINAGVVDYTGTRSPIFFWFQVGMSVLCVVIFGGAMLLVAAHDLGLI